MATLVQHLTDLATRIATEINTLRGERGFSAFAGGKLLANERIASAVAPYAITFNPANCVATPNSAPTNQAVFTIITNNLGQIGSFTINALDNVAHFTFTTATIPAGTIISIIAPATADATLGDLTILLKK